MVKAHQLPDIIVYPEEDGEVSESDKHLKQSLLLIQALVAFFQTRADVFVGGNLFVLYQRGDAGKVFSPDVMVVFGARPRPSEERPSWKVWEEGVLPSVIIELTSERTRDVDTIEKPKLYARLGVAEYYLFDPLGTLLTPRLQGFRLTAPGRYTPIPGTELDSPALGLRLVLRDGWLRLFNPATGTLLPTAEEYETALAEEHAARLAAEAEIARLRAELARRADG